jgi:DNA-binding CsgD family transcriptional regulator
LTRFAWMCARRAEAERFVEEAIAVLQTAPPGAELAWAYSHQSQLDMLASRTDSAIDWGERALTLAQQLGEKEIIIHALGNIGTAKADDGDASSGPELKQSLDLAIAGQYHDHVERASCNLTCASYWRRDYQSALAHIERGVAYADALDLSHWEGYLRGWRAMVWLDQGNWNRAEEEAQEICSRFYAAEMYRFPALIALARLRIRRGDQDADVPLEAARRLAAAVAEPQRAVYIAMILAEEAWLLNDAAAPATREAIRLLREVYTIAQERKAHWVAEDAALWLYMLGESVREAAHLTNPLRDHCEDRWESAAAGWRSLGRPYEEALALCGGDETAQRQALEIFDHLGATPAAARLRRQLRAGGSRAVPRGPIAGTRANAAGLTRRQAEVLGLVGEGLSNAEIARRLCISAKTAEHHVSAIMARLDVPTRKEAAAAARARGFLG